MADAEHGAEVKKGGAGVEEEKVAARPEGMDVDDAKRGASGVPQEIDLEEKRRMDHLENMDKIEKEFSDLKDKLFHERSAALDEEIKKVEAGTHERLLQRMKELEQQKLEKVQAAEQWRQYMALQTTLGYEAEKKQADDEYDLDKSNVKEELIMLFQERQRKLEDEKNTLILTDVNNDAGADSRAPNPRSLRRRGAGKDPLQGGAIKKKPSLPPHINYALKDAEIQDDIAAIAKTYIAPGRDVRGKTNEIFVDKGIFHYHDREFERGSTVSFQPGREPGKEPAADQPTTGVMTLIQVKSGDGARHRISLAQLRTGKYVLV